MTKPQFYMMLTLVEKMAVINEVEKGLTRISQIAKDFKILATALPSFF